MSWKPLAGACGMVGAGAFAFAAGHAPWGGLCVAVGLGLGVREVLAGRRAEPAVRIDDAEDVRAPSALEEKLRRGGRSTMEWASALREMAADAASASDLRAILEDATASGSARLAAAMLLRPKMTAKDLDELRALAKASPPAIKRAFDVIHRLPEPLAAKSIAVVLGD